MERPRCAALAWLAAAVASLRLAPRRRAPPPARERSRRSSASTCSRRSGPRPIWYRREMDPSLLDAASRRARITALPRVGGATTEIFCLQEVQESASCPPTSPRSAAASGRDGAQRPRLVVELGRSRDSLGAERHRDRRAQRCVPTSTFRESPARPTAITPRSSRPCTARPAAASAPRRSTSTATGVEPRAEVHVADGQLPPAAGTPTSSAATSTRTRSSAASGGVVSQRGLRRRPASVGQREPTHPWSSTYNGATRWAIIDHVTVRDARPLSGDVLDFGGLVDRGRGDADRVEPPQHRLGPLPRRRVAGF